jgi:hypothetical protein
MNSSIDLASANHTNRELELTLEGKKPLAFFRDEIGFLPREEIIPEERFRPYVECRLSGRLDWSLSGHEGPFWLHDRMTDSLANCGP